MDEITVNQSGDYSVFIEHNNGRVYVNGSGGSSDYRQIFHDISTDLRSWRSILYEQKHIPRQQTDSLDSWINAEHVKAEDRVALLVGAPGSGKSVVMHDLLGILEKREDVYVLGLKSDQVVVNSVEEMAQQNGIAKRMEDVIRELAGKEGVNRVVLLVDQIDALSLTLSSNRKPLRSILRFVENIQPINKVRIVVSCRPYDLEYDPFLEQFQFGNRVQMDVLPQSVVEDVLRENHRRPIPQGTNLFNTLRTPLFLYLFLKISDEGSPFDTTLTEHGLYGKLWIQTIQGTNEGIASGRVDYERLLGLLDLITDRMYEAQSLTLSRKAIDSVYSHELEYLLSEEFLVRVSDSRIQFFHQSLFDYIYARRFVERRGDLLESIRERHQGLFIRARVKSVLLYMREKSSSEFVQVVRTLLFDKNPEGKDTYRFHLKSLALSLMGYIAQPSSVEIQFVREELMPNEQYEKMFIKGIRSGGWFTEVQKMLDHSGGWEAMAESDCLLMLGICSQLIYSDQYLVLEYLNKYISKDISPALRESVVRILNSFRPEPNALSLSEQLYDKLIVLAGDYSLENYLRNISDMDLEFTLKRLRRIVSAAIEKSGKEKYIRDIQVPYELQHIYEKLLEHHPDQVYMEFVSIVEEICNASRSPIDKKLVQSSAYYMFSRISNPRMGYKFADDVLSIVIDETEKRAREGREGIVELVGRFNQSEFDTVRLIAACAYDVNPALFKDQILGVLTDSWLLSNCSSDLKYYYRKVLAQSFSSYSHEEQSRILDAIMSSERLYENKYTIKEHQKWGVGISLIDELKFEYLSDVPEDILRQDFNKIYKKKLEYMRRFGARDNKKPHRVTTHVGLTSIAVGPDGEKKMTSKQWLSAMRKYKSDITLSFEEPTLHGNAQLFTDHVARNPEKYLETIRTAFRDPDIPSEYAYAGIKGLIEAKYDLDTIEEIYVEAVQSLNPSVNENPASELITLIRQANFFIENTKHLNKDILNFLTDIVRNYNDVREDREEDESERDPYQSGINEVRGSACEYLVECYRFPEYKEEIFSAFESLPGNATIHTRSALLFKMALLNHLDANRSLDLYLKLMSDYRPNLLALPVHNLNPLVYYINYGFDRLVPLFEKAIETPFCHKEMVLILWLACAKKKDGADVLLNRMLYASNASKASLIQYFVQSYEQKFSQDLVIPWILKCLLVTPPDPELARTYDGIFDHLIQKWPDEVKEEVMALFLDGGWIRDGHRDFIDYLGAMALSSPEACLTWLNRTLKAAPMLLDDRYESSKIIQILIQAYNGLSDFAKKTPDLEFAMNLLDDILSKQEATSSLNVFLYHLDNA